MSVVEPSAPVVVRLTGNPANLYFRLGPIHARQLGLVPNPGREFELLLAEDADPDALLVLPNGTVFTAYELTTLQHKSGTARDGWEIWSQDGGGYPPTDA